VSVRRHLLFISPRFLFPMNEGGKIRTANILRGMQGGAFHITLASPVPANYQEFSRDIAGVCDRFVPWRAPQVSTARKIAGLLSPLPVGAWTDRSSEGSDVVAAALALRPDVVVADFPHSAVLLPPVVHVPSVMFTHNVETEIFERHAKITSGLWHFVWKDQLRKMQRFEAAVLSRFDRVVAVSARDAEALRSRFGLRAVDTIDTGVDTDFFKPMQETKPAPAGDAGVVCFTGVMDSPANIDGVRFLMDEVWPLVRKERPAAQMIVIGRNPPAALVAAARSRGLPWVFTGYVEDVRPSMAEADVCVIPLRAGSGTRIKAFEALAMGKPLISTRLGVEGLQVEDGAHYLAADTATEFANALLRVLSDANLREDLARAGRLLMETRFSWSRVSEQFEAVCLRATQRSDEEELVLRTPEAQPSLLGVG
jgi:glycosyltransferase involved in cell wall biosynthesis